MTVSDLPALNAILNTVAAILLILGYVEIKRSRVRWHRGLMLAALACSALFLTSYLVYHSHVGSVPYPHRDWTRLVYYAVLIPHVVLATVMVPFILVLLWHALRHNYQQHKRLARWTWPVWVVVSASGVTVYAMLYRI